MKIHVDVHWHDSNQLLVDAVTKLSQAVKTLGDTMERNIQELRTNQAETLEQLSLILEKLTTNDAREAALRAEIARLIDASSMAATEKAALQEEINAAVAESEDLENAARAGLAGVPPVGGAALLPNYADLALFQAAYDAYSGPETVMLDGTGVKPGTLPSLNYFTQEDGTISTTPL